MGDYHVHLHPHTWRSGDPDPHTFPQDHIERYVEQALQRGLAEVCFTEHLYRMVEAGPVLGEFWADEPADVAAPTIRFVTAERTFRLDDYVDSVLTARDRGLPVLLGMEVDYFPDTIDAVTELLAPYPWDLLVGAVHWVKGFSIDHDGLDFEFERRGVDRVWEAYFSLETELASSGSVDVLAHVDKVKRNGLRPTVSFTDWYRRVAEAAASTGTAVELSSRGVAPGVRRGVPRPGTARRLPPLRGRHHLRQRHPSPRRDRSGLRRAGRRWQQMRVIPSGCDSPSAPPRRCRSRAGSVRGGNRDRGQRTAKAILQLTRYWVMVPSSTLAFILITSTPVMPLMLSAALATAALMASSKLVPEMPITSMTFTAPDSMNSLMAWLLVARQVAIVPTGAKEMIRGRSEPSFAPGGRHVSAVAGGLLALTLPVLASVPTVQAVLEGDQAVLDDPTAPIVSGVLFLVAAPTVWLVTLFDLAPGVTVALARRSPAFPCGSPAALAGRPVPHMGPVVGAVPGAGPHLGGRVAPGGGDHRHVHR